MIQALMQFYPAIITIGAIVVLICYAILTAYSLFLRRAETKATDMDGKIVTRITNDALSAVGYVLISGWVLLAITAGNVTGSIVQLLTVLLYVFWVIGAVILFIRLLR